VIVGLDSEHGVLVLDCDLAEVQVVTGELTVAGALGGVLLEHLFAVVGE